MKRKILGVLTLIPILAFTFSACADKTLSIQDNSEAKITVKPTYSTALNATTDLTLSDEFLAELNDFSYKTTSTILSTDDENGNFSPLSLYYALALAATGANGKSQTEILNLLSADSSSELSKNSKELFNRLYIDDKNTKLKIANSIWTNKDIAFKKDFLNNSKENFYASIFNVDFGDSSTNTAMEDWVYENTNKTLKPDMDVDSDEIMALFNTIYFYDEWLDYFNPKKTIEDAFYLSNGTSTKCDFMNTKLTTGFSRGDNFLRSELNLKCGNSMVFILPDKSTSAMKLLSSPDSLKKAFEGGKETRGVVTYKIPKFKIKGSYDLTDSLEKLGVKDVFSDSADFSNMTDDPASITKIMQETHIAIDENGVEATAYTSLLMSGESIPPKEHAEMILNRPFLFGIKSSDGVLLFIGICENPIS